VNDTSKAHNVKVNAPRQAMNLPKLINQFGSEDRCRAYLEILRWPEGVRCPQCGSPSISRIKTRNQYDCNGCRNRFSVKSGTVFHDSHLPLWKWFLATYLICESRKGVSANQLKRTLGVSYKTAWYLCHRIRSAMSDPTTEPLLTGTVEADETWIGGKRRGYGSGRLNKSIVMGAIQRGGNIRLRALERGLAPSAQDLHEFLGDTVADETDAIYTDGHPGYLGIADENTRHETVDHHIEEWVRGDVSTQSIESAWSLKRSVVGSYHQLSGKHLQAYMDEFEFRFNNRENPFLFRDTLIRLVQADALTYRELVEDGGGH
jgi:transposase-like protein